MIHQFTRRDLDDGAVETLSLVRLDGDGSLLVQIESGTPADRERDFVGLFDLDGEAVQFGAASWELVEGRVEATQTERRERPEDVDGDGCLDVDAMFRGWEFGNTVVERWEEPCLER